MALFSKIKFLAESLTDKDLVDYKRYEIIEQRRVLKEIKLLSHSLRIQLAAEKQRRYRSVIRNKARMIRKEQAIERMKAKKKLTHNPYFK